MRRNQTRYIGIYNTYIVHQHVCKTGWSRLIYFEKIIIIPSDKLNQVLIKELLILWTEYFLNRDHINIELQNKLLWKIGLTIKPSHNHNINN